MRTLTPKHSTYRRMQLKTETTADRTEERVNAVAEQLRDGASDLLEGSGKRSARGEKAKRTASAMAWASDSLEDIGEGVRQSGLAVRDRARDSAKALSRGERILREGGFPGASARIALRARKHATTMAIVAGGVLAAAVVGKYLNRDR